MCKVIDIGEYKQQKHVEILEKVHARMSQAETPQESQSQDLHKEYDHE